MFSTGKAHSGGSSMSSLRGKHLVVAGESWLPYFNIREGCGRDGGGGVPARCCEGIMHDLLLHMSLALNFTYTLVRPPDGKWGVGDPATGEWNGMLGMLLRGEADLALGPFGVIYERTRACDFTQPVLIDYWATLVPLRTAADPWALSRAFDGATWGCLAASAASVLAALAATSAAARGRARLGPAAGYVARTLVCEPPRWTPGDLAHERLLTAAWSAFMVVMSVAYSSNLISLLTVPAAPPHVDSAEELVDQSDMGWAITSGSILDQIGSTASPDSVFGKLYAGARFGGECIDNLEDIKSGAVGQVCERMSILKILSDDFTATGRCNFYGGADNLFSTSFSMAFQLGSPYLAEVDRWLHRSLQMGFLSPWVARQVPNATACSGSLASLVASRDDAGGDGAENKSLTLSQTAPLFALCLVLLAAATAAMGMELAASRLLGKARRPSEPAMADLATVDQPGDASPGAPRRPKYLHWHEALSRASPS